MSIQPELLEILVCPKSKKPLVQDGDRLVSADPETRLAYRIEDGIPVLIVEEAIALEPDEWREVMQRHNIIQESAPTNG